MTHNLATVISCDVSVVRSFGCRAGVTCHFLTGGCHFVNGDCHFISFLLLTIRTLARFVGNNSHTFRSIGNIVCNTTDFLDDALDFFGKVDILINNVGGMSGEMMLLLAEQNESLAGKGLPPHMLHHSELWDKSYQLNLKSHVMLSNAVTSHFISQKSGSIVNISSVAARNPDPGNIAYAAF